MLSLLHVGVGELRHLETAADFCSSHRIAAAPGIAVRRQNQQLLEWTVFADDRFQAMSLEFRATDTEDSC